jgi:hypothetical protein
MLENNKYPKNWKHISINDEEYLQEYLEIKNCLKKN